VAHQPVQGTLSGMTPSALGNGDAAARPGTGRTQITRAGAARTARPTGQNSRHIEAALARNLLGMAIMAGNSAGYLVSEVIQSADRRIRGAIYVAFARGVLVVRLVLPCRSPAQMPSMWW
jgi:hypothetical protein